jgi:hypothetical protein
VLEIGWYTLRNVCRNGCNLLANIFFDVVGDVMLCRVELSLQYNPQETFLGRKVYLETPSTRDLWHKPVSKKIRGSRQGRATSDTICNGMQFHKDWGMHQ